VEVGENLLPHHLDGPQNFGGFHPRPAHPEDQVVGLEAPDPFLELLDDLVGVPRMKRWRASASKAMRKLSSPGNTLS